jgi:small-conductance mechanosensitive channel
VQARSRSKSSGRSARESPRPEPLEELADEEEPAPRGFLDFAVATEENTERLTVLINQVNSETNTLAARLEKRSEELNRANASGGGARLAFAITAHGARDMTEYADAVDEVLPELTQLVDTLGDDLSEFVSHFSLQSEDDERQAVQLRDTFLEQQQTVRESLRAISEFRSSTEDLPPISQATNAAKRRVMSTIDSLIAVFEKHEALTARTASLIDRVIEERRSPSDES